MEKVDIYLILKFYYHLFGIYLEIYVDTNNINIQFFYIYSCLTIKLSHTIS